MTHIICACCKERTDPDDIATETHVDVEAIRAAFGGDVCLNCGTNLVRCHRSEQLVLIGDCDVDRDGNYYAKAGGQIHLAGAEWGRPLNDWGY